MRLIDADAFDRRLANAQFIAALNNADDNDRPFEHEAMYYSTQSFRDVMSHQPTVDAIPVEWLEEKLEQKRHQQYGRLGVAAITKVLMYWHEEQEAHDEID